MTSKARKLLWISAAGLVVLALAAVLWIQRFHRYTPIEAIQDLKAAAAVGAAPRPVERFLELRYGPMTDPANRQRAFLDFFNVGHIEGLYLLVGRMPEGHKEANITAMADWIANYRNTLSPAEKQALGTYVRSDTGRAMLQSATSQYLAKDVRFRAETAGVIAELMTTLSATQAQ